MEELKARFTSYIKICLKHDSIDYFRKYNKNKINNTSLNIGEVKDASLSHESDIDAFSFFYLGDIEDKRIKYAISTLTDRQKKILELYVNGKKSKEIGNELNIATNTVTATISQIKKKIKTCLER